MRTVGVGLVVLAAAVTLRAQDRPTPVVLSLAKPMSAVEAAARLTGTWKLNQELSPPLRAGWSGLAGAGEGGPPSGRRSGRGNGGRPVAYEAKRLEEERNLRVRALYRELSTAPEVLALEFTLAVAKFVDQDGFERRVNVNSKKEKLDLGTTIIDSRSQWDGTSLTIELDAGSDLKVREIFELSPTGTQMLVTIRAGDEHDAKARGLRAQVQRVYDRVNAGLPGSDR